MIYQLQRGGLVRKAIVIMAFLSMSCELSSAQDRQIQGLPFIKNYNSQDYNAGIQNWAITQDKQGLLYVANNFGLLEFDGNKWSTFNTGKGSKLRSVYIDDSGRIYVGSQVDFGYFYPDQNGEFTYTSLVDQMKPGDRNFDEAWKIYEVNGSVYFCTFKNIYSFSDNDYQVFSSPYSLEISFLVDDDLYVQEWQRGLSIIKNGEIQLIPSGEFFKDKRISGIFLLEKDKLMISTFDDGLFTYEKGTIEPFNIIGDVDLRKAIVSTLQRLRNGNIALGTQNQGLYIIDKLGALQYHLDRNSGLIDRHVNSIYEDFTGNLWLGMNFGISRIELNSPFSIIDERLGVPGSGYNAFLDDGKVYLGTNNGLYTIRSNRFNNLDFEEHIKRIEGSEGQVYSVSKQNDQLIMGHHNGAFVVGENKVEPISSEKGAWLFAQLPGNPQYYIQGSYLGLNLYKAYPSGLQIQHKIEGFSESSRIIGFDDKNNIWVTQGNKGAYRLRLSSDLKRFDKVEFYNERSGFPSNLFINVFDINNALLFSSQHGFYDYDEPSNAFVPNELFNELIGAESSLSDMDEDEMGNIYYIEKSQIGKLSPSSFENYDLETAVFNKIYGLLNDDLGNVNILDHQNILFGASQGFIHYNPMYRFETNDAFKVLLRDVRNVGSGDSTYFVGNYVLDGLVLEQQPDVQVASIPFQKNSIKFTYSGIHFESDNKIKYSFRLNNFDESWSEWSSTNEKEYTNLPEGDYNFQVKARNVYGQESNTVFYKFEITPPFYRTKIAYGFYTLSGFSFLFLGFSVLDKKYKKEKLRLAKDQERELDLKDSEIKDITEQSEREIIELKNQKLSAEIQHKNNELTSSAMHLIQKNQLLNNIKNTLTNLTKEGKEDQQKSINYELGRIVKSISRDLSNTEDWKIFETNFDKVHGNFLTRLKEGHPQLTPQELKLSAYLRMNLNTKEMADLLNISVRGVEIGRYRVRKKLGLQRSDNLTDFILRF